MGHENGRNVATGYQVGAYVVRVFRSGRNGWIKVLLRGCSARKICRFYGNSFREPNSLLRVMQCVFE